MRKKTSTRGDKADAIHSFCSVVLRFAEGGVSSSTVCENRVLLVYLATSLFFLGAICLKRNFVPYNTLLRFIASNSKSEVTHTTVITDKSNRLKNQYSFIVNFR